MYCGKSGWTIFLCGCSHLHHIFCVLQPPASNDVIPSKSTILTAYCAFAQKLVVLPLVSLRQAFNNTSTEAPTDKQKITAMTCLQGFYSQWNCIFAF